MYHCSPDFGGCDSREAGPEDLLPLYFVHPPHGVVHDLQGSEVLSMQKHVVCAGHSNLFVWHGCIGPDRVWLCYTRVQHKE